MKISNRTPTDNEIIEGIKAGDTKILEHIINKIFPEVQALLIKKGSSQATSADMTAIALEAIFLKTRTQEITLKNASFKSYFTQICLFQWYKVLRRYNSHQKVTTKLIKVSKDELGIEEFLVQQRRYSLYEKKLKELGEKCRNIIIWAFQENMSISKIAQKLKINEGAARKRKFDCKTKLIALIQKDVLYRELIYGA